MSEEYQIPLVNENLLTRVGVLITDIKKGLPMPIDPEQIDYLKFEFMQIGLRTVGLWSTNEVGLTYFLQFHQGEAKRLLKEINKEIKALSYVSLGLELKSFKKLLYRQVKDGLEETINTMKSLESGEGIKLDIEN